MTYNVFGGTSNLAQPIKSLHNQAPQCLVDLASLSPVSPLDNIFTLPAEVFSSCLAIVSAVMVNGLFLWPALRYETGYQTVWEIQPSADSFKRSLKTVLFSAFTRVHSALELFGRCALQIYLLAYLLTYLLIQNHYRHYYQLKSFVFTFDDNHED